MEKILQSLKANLKKWSILALIVAGGLFAFSCARKHVKKATQAATTTVLKPNEAEKIIINASDHKVTVVTPTKTTSTYFSNNTVITEDKNGKLSIYNPSWDFKFHPTVGFGISDKPKLFVGVSPLGYKKLDLNIGLEIDCQHFNETAINTSIGYNVHNATYLFLGINNHKNIEGGLRFRF